MKIKVVRAYKRDTYTIGKMYVNGVYFCDTLEDKDRGLSQGMTLQQITGIKVKGKTAIPCGRYTVLETYSNRFKKVMPEVIGVKGFAGIRIHCLTPDMEVLTEKGWQNMADFEQSPAANCYSYNTETGKAELVPVAGFIKQDYKGELYTNTGRRVNYSVTDKHRMWVGTPTRDRKMKWGFRTADDLCVNTSFLTAVTKDGEELSRKQLAFCRLMMAVQADGYILNRSKKSSAVKFHFTKQRKIDRVKELIEGLDCKYTSFIDKEGKTHINLEPKLATQVTEEMNPCRYMFNYKELPVWLLELNSATLKDLLMTYLFFDGRWENYLRNNHNMIISSTNRRTLDILQAMAVLCGMRSYIHQAHGSNCYEIVLYDNQNIIQPQSDTYSTKQYNGTVWCLTNRNHTLIVRKNYRPMIIGNCGNTADDTEGCLLVGENKAKGKVLNSRFWYTNLNDRINLAVSHGETVELEIG